MADGAELGMRCVFGRAGEEKQDKNKDAEDEEQFFLPRLFHVVGSFISVQAYEWKPASAGR
jgi:hypothetical protein